MHTHDFIPILAALLVTAACQVDPKGTSDSDPTGEPTAGTETSAETETGEGATETSPDTDEGATETSPDTDSGATETGETSETGETGEPACGDEDPATSATFKVALDGWPEQSDAEHDVERDCTIDAVSSEGAAVITTLTCDVDGVPLGASFEIAAAPEGEVDWAAGQAVRLSSRAFGDEFGGNNAVLVTLAGDPDALLVHGQDWWGDGVPASQTFGPIVREVKDTCTFDADFSRNELNYSLASGANVSIRSGHRGVLPIDMTHVYAIDLAHSGSDCCHGSEHSLIRRVKSG